MKKSVFLVPLVLFALAMNASVSSAAMPRRPAPSLLKVEKLDTLGIEFLQMLGARNQQQDLISDKVKELLERGNTVIEASVAYDPNHRIDIFRTYKIKAQQCSTVIERGHPVNRCLGGAELEIIKYSERTRNGVIVQYITQLTPLR